MYVSLDDGATWDSFQQNLPATPITDLKVVDQDLYVSTMGRSFWIMDNLTVLHQAQDGFDHEAAALFQPRDAYRMRGGGGFFGFGDTAPIRPQFAPTGVMLDYWVPAGGGEDLKLEILDESGTVIRSFGGGAAAGPARAGGQGMRAPFGRRGGGPSFATTAGAHRMVWDLNAETERGRALVPPGTFSARLTSAGEAVTRSFEVLMDPRVAADGVTEADLREQYELGLTIAALVTEANEVAARVQAGAGKATGEAAEAFAALRERMVDDPVGSYPKPMLLNQVRYLSGMVGRADQKPGRDAYTRLEQLRAELTDIVRELERLERLIA